MSRYDNDDRVHPHPDGTFMIFDDRHTEFNVAPWGDLWTATDARGRDVTRVPDGPFDDVVHALIGDPE